MRVKAMFFIASADASPSQRSGEATLTAVTLPQGRQNEIAEATTLPRNDRESDQKALNALPRNDIQKVKTTFWCTMRDTPLRAATEGFARMP